MSELRNYVDHENEIKEIINGKIYYMAGTFLHAKIITRLGLKFNNYFISTNKNCMAYTESVNVYLDSENKKEFSVPDITIICDESKAFKRGYKGSPELVVEVVSRKTRTKDRGDKYDLFEKFGVKEYWIIEPRLKSIEQYVLENGRYKLKDAVALPNIDNTDEPMEEDEEDNSTVIRPTMFEDLEIDLNDIFLKGDERFLKEDD
ncbi:MAG: Uma2 family endonuclease [Oscillospiraceae bacterium]|nr:Uma2 family endonuclease [Oscillospiraceae bacterium]